MYVDDMLITWLSAVCAMNEAECVLQGVAEVFSESNEEHGSGVDNHAGEISRSLILSRLPEAHIHLHWFKLH